MPPTPLRKTLWTVRYGVPIGLALIGVVILAIERSTTGVEAWGMFTGAAGAVLLLNGLYRIGARGDADRDEEESAREHFAAHGDWPATAQAGGREWTLPVGVVTLEAEDAAKAARAAATAGQAPPGAGSAPSSPERPAPPATG